MNFRLSISGCSFPEHLVLKVHSRIRASRFCVSRLKSALSLEQIQPSNRIPTSISELRKTSRQQRHPPTRRQDAYSLEQDPQAVRILLLFNLPSTCEIEGNWSTREGEVVVPNRHLGKNYLSRRRRQDCDRIGNLALDDWGKMLMRF